MEIANMIPVFETVSTAIKSYNLASNDIDENLVDNINSKYYTVDDFLNIKSGKNCFNIFHGYECNNQITYFPKMFSLKIIIIHSLQL